MSTPDGHGNANRSSRSDNGAPSPTTLRRVSHWLVLVASATFGFAFVIGGAHAMLTNSRVFEIGMTHFAATIGLPSAALAALCIVVVLEGTAGPIQLEGLGFKFKGAAGPIVFWIFCFLAITSAIHLLW
jgi:hypothetical protein